MQTDAGDITRVCDAIVYYLQRNPGAADTVDGIMRWWLPEQYQATERKTVEEALNRLVVRKLVKRRVLPEGTILCAGAAPPERK